MLMLFPLSFMLGAVLYTGLAVWRASIGAVRGTPMLLGLGFAGMAAWDVASLLGGPTIAVLAEIGRNVVWTGYLIAIIRQDRAAPAQRWLGWLLSILMGLAATRAALVLAYSLSDVSPGQAGLLIAIGCSLAFCIAGLVFVQSLYFAAHEAASGFRLILFALALLWAYDLNLYAAVLLQFRVPILLAESRGIVALALAPLFAIAARRKQYWSIALSRRLAFQSLSVIAIGAYLIFVATVASARPWLSGYAEAAGQIAALVVASAVTLGLLASSRLRAVVRVSVSKHLFAHRYDYRVEWLRFNATINSGGLVGLSPEQRAVKALADLMDSASGVLFLCEGRDRLVCVAKFERFGAAPSISDISLPPGLIERIETDSHVMVGPHHGGERDAADFPAALRDEESVWLLVPLVRLSGLVGLVALGPPSARRQLDWEDFDLLKVLGQHIATYVADARSQAELEEARQFEEFNRRFAFIVHDIKNVVSQLSLVAANAEEHGANPRFQADMAATLRNSVGKMTTLLSRLSLDSRTPRVALEPVEAQTLLAEVAKGRRAQHPLIVTEGEPFRMLADRAKLLTAVDHLVQNAIEASEPASPVTLSARRDEGRAVLTVRDEGTGMSTDFIRRQLFKPFASTKAAGFGIGAAEARTLVRQMGGEVEVTSVEGVGTSFVITLPLLVADD